MLFSSITTLKRAVAFQTYLQGVVIGDLYTLTTAFDAVKTHKGSKGQKQQHLQLDKQAGNLIITLLSSTLNRLQTTILYLALRQKQINKKLLRCSIFCELNSDIPTASYETRVFVLYSICTILNLCS